MYEIQWSETIDQSVGPGQGFIAITGHVALCYILKNKSPKSYIGFRINLVSDIIHIDLYDLKVHYNAKQHYM